MGFLSVPNLVLWLIPSHCRILGFVTDQFFWIRLLFKDSSSKFTAMGVDSGLPIVVGGRDDYSREAINRETAITVFEDGILFRVVTQQRFSLPKKETPRAQTRLVKIQVVYLHREWFVHKKNAYIIIRPIVKWLFKHPFLGKRNKFQVERKFPEKSDVILIAQKLLREAVFISKLRGNWRFYPCLPVNKKCRYFCLERESR